MFEKDMLYKNKEIIYLQFHAPKEMIETIKEIKPTNIGLPFIFSIICYKYLLISISIDNEEEWTNWKTIIKNTTDILNSFKNTSQQLCLLDKAAYNLCNADNLSFSLVQS